jgi:hypothetical protein
MLDIPQEAREMIGFSLDNRVCGVLVVACLCLVSARISAQNCESADLQAEK